MGNIILFGKDFKQGSMSYAYQQIRRLCFAANATFIVSDDKHFEALKEIQFPKILVLKLKEFLGILTKEQ